MKKIFLLLLVVFFAMSTVAAATLQTAISKYKYGNYAGCIGDLEQVGKVKQVAKIVAKYDVKKIGPKYAVNDYKDTDLIKLNNELKKVTQLDLKADRTKLAYSQYYYALSMHQLGMSSNAAQHYALAAFFSPDSQIGRNSERAMKCLKDPSACPTSDMDEFIRSGKQVSDEIVKQELQENLKTHHRNINKEAGAQMPAQSQYGGNQYMNNGQPQQNGTTPQGQPAQTGNPSTSWLNKNEKVAWADEGIIPDVTTEQATYNKASSDSDMPTDEEIGKAIRVLQRAGINPMTYANTAMDSEYAQMNAMLNDGYGSYGYNPMAQMMMMNYGTQKMSPEVMQVLMQQQMMGAYGSY